MSEPHEVRQTRRIRVVEVVVLIAILALGTWLRFRGIDWGGDFYLHPDELYITMVMVEISPPESIGAYFDAARSTFNPYNTQFDSFVYGTFPLFAAKLLAMATDNDVFGAAHLPGRWLSAIADLGSVVLLWTIGRQLFGRAIGLLAALLLAATMLHVQAAHYFTTDAMSAFFATATFAAVLTGWRRRSFAFFALAGLAAGLAAASKPNLLICLGFLALPILETIRLAGWSALWPRRRGADDEDPSFPVILASSLGGFVAVWTFRLAQPYAFAGPSLLSFRLNPQWTQDLEFWRRAQAGQIDLPPSIQWTDRTPVIFMLDNLVRWGMGPGLGIAVLGGLALLLIGFARAQRWPSWWLLGIAGFVLFHIAFYGTGMAKVQRYLLPAYPLLVLLGAVALDRVFCWGIWRGAIGLPGLGRIRLPIWAHPGTLLPVMAVVSTILWAVAFSSIYERPITRDAASRWMYDTIPPGSTIATEYWDFALPLVYPDNHPDQYTRIELDLYRTDSDEKLSRLIGQLHRSDYIVISSNRLFESIPRMPDRYPMTIAYYEALFSGDLGFDLIGRFTSFPELFDIEIDDSSAEESLTVYEHPEVLVFAKTPEWSDDAAWYLLDDALGEGGVTLYPVQTQPSAMMLTEREADALEGAGGWNSGWHLGTIGNRLPPLVWYLVLHVLTLPMVPIMWRLLPRLPDRGYALARTVGLFGLAWLTWMLATFTPLTVGPALVVGWLGLAALAIGACQGNVALLYDDFLGRRKWIRCSEAVFLVAFVAALAIRSLNPWPFSTAQPASDRAQQFGIFTSLVRSPVVPPYDPALAGGVIHDFVFGFAPFALLARVTGIESGVAISLTLATAFALIALNLWFAAVVLIGAVGHRTRPDLRVRVLALAAPVIACGVGSLDFARRIGDREWGNAPAGGVVSVFRGLWRVAANRQDLPADAWLAPSLTDGRGTTPFPLLRMMSGDVDSAFLALPLFVAGAAIAIAWATSIARPDALSHHSPLGRLDGFRAATPPAVLTGAAAGMTALANPLAGGIVLGLTAIVLALAIGVRAGWDIGWREVRDGAIVTLAVAVVTATAALPLLARYGAWPIDRIPQPTPIEPDDYAAFLGLPLIVVAGWMAVQFWTLAAGLRDAEPLALGGLVLCGVLTVTLLVMAAAIGSTALVLVVLLGLVGVVVWHRQHDGGYLSTLALVAVAVVVGVAATRYEYVRPIGLGSLQDAALEISWMLLALAATSALAMLAGARRTHDWVRGETVLGRLALGVAIIGLLAASLYPALAIPNLAASGGETSAPLDALAIDDADVTAAAWLRENVDGLPVILEAPGVSPALTGRISALTGLPTVIADQPRQFAQRPGMEPIVLRRIDDVDAIYDRPVPWTRVAPIAAQYDAGIIYVGPAERSRYDSLGLGKFDDAVANGDLTLLYQDGDVAIYGIPGSS